MAWGGGMAKGEVWPLTVLLLAMHTCAGGAVGGTMYVSPSPMSLSAAIAEVCWRDESSAGYIAGKTFEIIFGPAVLKGEVDAGIPYLEDVRVVRSHAQVGPVSSSSCKRSVTLMFDGETSSHLARHREILNCASGSLLTKSSGRSQIMVASFLASEVSYRTNYHPSLVCQAMRSDGIAQWAGGITTEDVVVLSSVGGGDNPQTCSGGDGERCSGGYPLHPIELCQPEEWRLCSSARAEDRSDVTSGVLAQAAQAAVSGLDIVRGLLDAAAVEIVRREYLAVLERPADLPGLEAYVSLLASGGGAEEVTASLIESQEYTNLGKVKTDVKDVSAAARATFMDVLLRQGTEVELSGFVDLLVAQGTKEGQLEMRRILEETQEYKDICLSTPITCEGAKQAVTALFKKVLERDPDSSGLAEYSRQLVAGHTTEVSLKNQLRQSSEYVNLISHRHGLIDAAEAVKLRYRVCQEPSQNFSHPYWKGRWCDRSGCHAGNCRGFPLEVYQQVQAVYWGGMPLSEVSEDGGAKLKAYRQAECHVLKAYVGVLGRFPDPMALKSHVGRLARGEETAEELERGLVSSDERRERESEAKNNEGATWESVDLLSDLIRRNNVDLPGGMSSCFDRSGKATKGSGGCSLSGGILHELMTVWNEQGPLLGRKPQSGEPPHFFPVAMYVHNRLHYFQHTLRNLKKAQGVSQLPLLIISMDSVNAEMLKLAENVAFAPLRILFHPPRVDLMRPQSIIAIKEHWLWLQDMIWGGGVREIAGTDGHVALLEEDHAVTPDYLRVMQKLIEEKARSCPTCWGVCARYGCSNPHDTDTKKLCASFSVINTGIIFNRTTYNSIKASDFECFPDGWDWSLFHMAQTGQMVGMMLGPAVSRLQNVGTEGATVTQNDNSFLQEQLMYNKVSGEDLYIEKHEFFLDPSKEMVYEPPMWQPMWIGSMGYAAPNFLPE